MATDIEVIVDPAAITTAATVATEAPIASVTLAVGAPGPQGPAGANGQNGTNGSDASVTEENIIAALGYTPADAANAGNPFNQSLNTTDVATFLNVYAENAYVSGDITGDQILQGGYLVATQNWINSQGFASGSLIPSSVSQLTNDSGYITADQSLNTTDSPSFSELTTASWAGGSLSWGASVSAEHGQAISDLANGISGVNTTVNGKVDNGGNISVLNNDAGYITAADVPAQVKSDWNATSGVAEILNKPTLFSGAYADLTGKPTLFSGSAADLTGTLADARLSSNVALDNQNNSFTAGQSITADENTSALTASYSVTGANTTPLLALSGTWNTTGIARGILLNITNTASATNSLLMDLQVGGTSRFSVGSPSNGFLTYSSSNTVGTTFSLNCTATGGQAYGFFSTGGGNGSGGGIFGVYNNTTANFAYACTGFGFGIPSNSFYGFFNTVSSANPSTYDVRLYRDAANTLAQRNGTAGQNFSIYSSFTDASNYSRLSVRASNVNTRYSIAVESGGTGTIRSLELSGFSSSSDPTSSNITSGSYGVWKNSTSGAVKLWYNDGGTMKSVTLS
jgi:hypothetical protein